MYRSTVSLTEKMLTDSSQLNESPGLENTDYKVFLEETVPGLEYGFPPKCSCVGYLASDVVRWEVIKALGGT